MDWRDFLSFANNSLAENGRLIILCPNYGFPYESHFHLPIIVNKSLTKTVQLYNATKEMLPED